MQRGGKVSQAYRGPVQLLFRVRRIGGWKGEAETEREVSVQSTIGNLIAPHLGEHRGSCL